METRRQALIQFLQEEMAIPPSDLQLALQSYEPIPSLLPMVLWQYGFVNLSQLSQIFDWLEQVDREPPGF